MTVRLYHARRRVKGKSRDCFSWHCPSCKLRNLDDWVATEKLAPHLVQRMGDAFLGNGDLYEAEPPSAVRCVRCQATFKAKA